VDHPVLKIEQKPYSKSPPNVCRLPVLQMSKVLQMYAGCQSLGDPSCSNRCGQQPGFILETAKSSLRRCTRSDAKQPGCDAPTLSVQHRLWQSPQLQHRVTRLIVWQHPESSRHPVQQVRPHSMQAASLAGCPDVDHCQALAAKPTRFNMHQPGRIRCRTCATQRVSMQRPKHGLTWWVHSPLAC